MSTRLHVEMASFIRSFRNLLRGRLDRRDEYRKVIFSWPPLGRFDSIPVEPTNLMVKGRPQ